MVSLQEILELSQTATSADKEIIKKAYSYAEKAHANQRRYSNDPYFDHLTETAKILAELGMDYSMISAGLLHDVIEDVQVSAEELEKEFGKEILFLIEGVTKLGKIRYKGSNKHNESLRKLFVAMSQDIRVLIIKLADRLHNMRTLSFVPKEKQKRIATETLEIYAPIAYRLGIRKLNRELEDLAFPYVYPEEYVLAKKVHQEKQNHDIERLEKFHRSLAKALVKQGLKPLHTDYRIKGLYSLYKKWLKKGKDTEKIYDIAALRVIVSTVSDCYKALGIIHGTWRPYPGRIKDYIAFPKPNGYKSLHTTIFTGDGNLIEIQIKTEEMYHESEYGIASHFNYKSNKQNFKKNQSTSGFMWVKNLLPNMNSSAEKAKSQKITNLKDTVPNWIRELVSYQKTTVDDEFEKSMKRDFFEERIFVFTPKGDVIDLPIDSSPIDFAYAIHSDIGNHTAGVKMNGKFVSLDTKLKNGDIIEIQTKDSSHPTAKWLELTKTTMARKHIKTVLPKDKNQDQ